MANNDKKSINKNNSHKLVWLGIILLITLCIPLITIVVHKIQQAASVSSKEPIVTNEANESIVIDKPSNSNNTKTAQASQTEEITSTPSNTNTPSETNIQTITPQPSFDPNFEYVYLEKQQLINYLAYLLEKNEGTYGLAFYDFNKDEYIGINDIGLYVAASSTKVPMALYACKLVQDGVLSFDQIVEYQESDFEAGTGVIQKGSYGDTYTLAQLIEYSMLYSDNCAINMIIRIIGEWQIVQYMNSLGAEIDYINQRWKTCPHDLLIYHKELLKLADEYPEYYLDMLTALTHSTVAYQLSSRPALPYDITAAIKSGINVQLPTLNETNAVLSNKPFIYSYCSTGINIDDSAIILQSAASALYSYANNDKVKIEKDIYAILFAEN